MANVKLGPFAEIEFGEGDMVKALAVVSANAGKPGIMEQFGEWSKLRDDYLGSKARMSSKLTCKVTEPRAKGTNGKDDKGSEGGALSIYGLQRFPVTLYRNQWERLLSPETAKQIREFIAANDDKLKVK